MGVSEAVSVGLSGPKKCQPSPCRFTVKRTRKPREPCRHCGKTR